MGSTRRSGIRRPTNSFRAVSRRTTRRARNAIARRCNVRPALVVLRCQAPIFALAARLVAQKGLDLILGDPGYFAFDAQYVFLGHGEASYESMLTELAEGAPGRGTETLA